MPSDSPRRLDASNGSNIGLTSTSIDGVSISVYSDGPMKVSSGIDPTSLSDSSIGSKVLELLPLSPDVREHDDELIEIPPRDIIEKKNTTLPTMESEREHKYPRQD